MLGEIPQSTYRNENGVVYHDVHCKKPTPQLRHSWQFNMNTSILGA
jgi:hypothetical protein